MTKRATVQMDIDALWLEGITFSRSLRSAAAYPIGGIAKGHVLNKLTGVHEITGHFGAPKMWKYLALVALAASLTGAHADEVKPLEAQLITLGDVQGVAYFTEETDGFRVVTTLAQGDGGRPIRLIATLNDGQSVRLGIPHGVNEAEEAIEIVRDGKVLMLRDPVEPLTASIR